MDGRDSQELLRSLGVLFGIAREVFKLLSSHTKLFVSLTITLIAPLCVLGLGPGWIIGPIVGRIQWDEFISHFEGSHFNDEQHRIEEDGVRLHLANLYVLLGVYAVSLLAFSLLATSAVIYSIDCIYSERIASCKRALSAIPRIWIRLVATFVWAIAMISGYCVLFLMVFTALAIVFALISPGNEILMRALLWSGLFLFMGGFTYLSCLWHLGCVITVLEDSYGLLAIRKSMSLIKGMRITGISLFLVFFALDFMIALGFDVWDVHGESFTRGTKSRVVIDALLIGVMSFMVLLGLLMQTVFYFACKTYHNEKISRLGLSTGSGVFLLHRETTNGLLNSLNDPKVKILKSDLYLDTVHIT